MHEVAIGAEHGIEESVGEERFYGVPIERQSSGFFKDLVIEPDLGSLRDLIYDFSQLAQIYQNGLESAGAEAQKAGEHDREDRSRAPLLDSGQLAQRLDPTGLVVFKVAPQSLLQALDPGLKGLLRQIGDFQD